jgi:segregation and condensation protein B
VSGVEEPSFIPPTHDEQDRMVEAILFSSVEPLSAEMLERRMPKGSNAAESLRRLEGRYAGRGVTLTRVAGKWVFRTASDLSFLLRSEETATKKLSRAATETLAIVAYHQPVTRTEIEEVRGVAVSRGTLDLLLDAGWIGLGRRRESPGRPVTFVTTDGFLDHFGLESVRDLPGLDELKAAGLLDARPAGGLLPDRDRDDDDGDDDDTPEEDQGDLLPR